MHSKRSADDVGGQARVLARIVQVGEGKRFAIQPQVEIRDRDSYLCLPDLLAQYYGTNNQARCCLLDSDDIVVTLVLVAGGRFCFYRRWLMMADTVDEGWTSQQAVAASTQLLHLLLVLVLRHMPFL